MATPTPLALYWVYQKHRYPVVQAHLQLTQATDYKGQPSARVGAQVVRFVIDSAEAEAQLAAYMFDPYRRAHSHFEAEYDSGSVRRWLEVQAAYLVRMQGQFDPARPDAWPATCLHLGLSAAALVRQGITLECHSVLPWAAPAEVQRRARMEGLSLPAAAAMPEPKQFQPFAIQATTPAPNKTALKSNKNKGQYGEHTSDAYLHAQRHKKLSDGGKLAPLPPVPARGTGIDSVWKHHAPPPDYIIVEAKYGSSQLGCSKDGKQMSDSWIRGSNRLERATSPKQAILIRAAMRSGRVEKRLHRIDSTGLLTETILL